MSHCGHFAIQNSPQAVIATLTRLPRELPEPSGSDPIHPHGGTAFFYLPHHQAFFLKEPLP